MTKTIKQLTHESVELQKAEVAIMILDRGFLHEQLTKEEYLEGLENVIETYTKQLVKGL